MGNGFWKVLAAGLLLSLAAHAQSLGDVARENREKQNANAATGVKPKVITNKDLPQDADNDQQSHAAEPAQPRPAVSRNEYSAAAQSQAEAREAEQWRRQIRMQETRIANLELRLEQVNVAMHATGGNPRQMERASEIQLQLDEQRRQLEDMQESARRAGMHTAVYDP